MLLSVLKRHSGNSRHYVLTNEQEPLNQQEDRATPNVNVFDYQVPSFDEGLGRGQEMEERGGRPLLSRSSTAGPVQPSQNADAMWDQVDDKAT